MALTNVLNIPQVSLPVGTRAFTTSNFAAINNNWSITLNLVSWPASGNVITLTIEASLDGVNFQPDASIDLSAPQVDKAGNPVSSISWTTSAIPNTSKLRLTVDCLQACTVSGSVVVQ